MGFIPPDIAVYEEGVEYRSFEINDIPLNSNFTFGLGFNSHKTKQATERSTSIPRRSRLAGALRSPARETTLALNGNQRPKTLALIGGHGGYCRSRSSVVGRGGGILVAGVILYKAVIDRERGLNKTRCPTKRRIFRQLDEQLQYNPHRENPLAQPAPGAKTTTRRCFDTNMEPLNRQ